MISIMQREIVDRHGWLDEEEFLDQLAVAQSMPGILAVNISVAVGDKIRGGAGSLCAALGTIMPSFLIILTIAVFLTPDLIRNSPVLSKVFMGMRPAVVALIIAPVITSARSAKISWRTAWIPAGAALLIWSGWPVVSKPDSVCGAWRCGRLSVVWHAAAAERRRRGNDLSETDMVVFEDRPFRVRWRLCDVVADRARGGGSGMDHVEDVYRYSGHFADDSRSDRDKFGDVYRVCDSERWIRRLHRRGGAVGFGVVYVCGGGAVVSALCFIRAIS